MTRGTEVDAANVIVRGTVTVIGTGTTVIVTGMDGGTGTVTTGDQA